MAFEGVPRGTVIKGPADGEEPVGETWAPSDTGETPAVLPAAVEASYNMVDYVADLPPLSGELGRVVPTGPAPIEQSVPPPPRPKSN